MKKISSIVTNYDTATSGFSEGKLRDNPGDDTGSSVVAALGNDWYYALAAVVKAQNSLGAVSDNPESESNHDFLDALLEMAGQKVNGVADWSAATTYSTANTHVMRAGIQFTNGNTTGNLNKDPLTTDGYWIPVPESKALFSDWKEGRIISGGSAPLHDYNNALYKQYFSLGKHRFGGYGGSVFEAYGVHLDGSNVGSGDLSTIIETWALKNSWAPGSIGARTIVDVRGRVMRFIEATGGRADLMAELLADQFQGFGLATLNQTSGATHYHDSVSVPGKVAAAEHSAVSSATITGSIVTDGTNGTPRTGTVTADKSVTVGVPYAVIMVPA